MSNGSSAILADLSALKSEKSMRKKKKSKKISTLPELNSLNGSQEESDDYANSLPKIVGYKSKESSSELNAGLSMTDNNENKPDSRVSSEIQKVVLAKVYYDDEEPTYEKLNTFSSSKEDIISRKNSLLLDKILLRERDLSNINKETGEEEEDIDAAFNEANIKRSM